MMKTRTTRWRYRFAVMAAAVSLGCNDPAASDETCYHVDSEEEYEAYLVREDGFCAYERGEVTPLIEEHGPVPVDYYGACEVVPIDHVCQSCPADEIDDKIMAALEVEYADRCPDEPHDIIAFERGCVVETSIATSEDTKNCCYFAIVVGECSLKQ